MYVWPNDQKYNQSNINFLKSGIRLFADDDDDSDDYYLPVRQETSIDLPKSRPEDVTMSESSNVLIENEISFSQNINSENIVESDKSDTEAENEMFRVLQRKVDERIEKEKAEIQELKEKERQSKAEKNYAIDDINEELYQNQEGHPLIAHMMRD